MNDKIVLDFGSIVSQMESEGLRLLTVKDNNSLFVVDGKDNLYVIEPYYAGGYLDKFIGERNVISFELIEQPAINFEDWRKKFLDAAWVKDFIERIVKTEYPDFEKTSPLHVIRSKPFMERAGVEQRHLYDFWFQNAKSIDMPIWEFMGMGVTEYEHWQRGELKLRDGSYQDMRDLAFSEGVSGEQSEVLQDACKALEEVYDAARQLEHQPVREEDENLSDLRDKLTARIEALGNAPVTTDAQKEAIQVAIGALKAAYDGVEVMESYAEHQNSHGMRLSDAFHALSDIPAPSTDNALQDAIKAASEAIEAADLHKEMSPEKAPPEKKVLECSIRGDRRFSSLFAKVTINGKERSIEEWFQDAKRTADGKKAGKGKPFDYIVDPFTGDKLPGSEAQWMYRGLWITYFAKNPELVKYAEQFDEFTNCFNKYRNPESEEDLPRGPGQFNLTRLESSVEEVIGAYVKGDRDRYVAVVKASNWYKNMARKREHSRKPALDAKIQDAHERQTEQDKPADQMSLFSRGGYNRGL